MKSITITFTAPAAPAAQKVDNICRVFVPENAAADNAVFEGTYYDTNVAGWAVAETLEEFFNNSVAHPGLIAALKQAMKNGTCTFEASDMDAIYMNEVSAALADQGFAFEIE